MYSGIVTLKVDLIPPGLLKCCHSDKETCMLAVVVKEFNKFALEDVAKPVIETPSDVIVRVTATALCSSDLKLIKGHFPVKLPFIPGHEFVGVVESAGSAVTMYKPGSRVAAPPSPYCGICDHCRQGLYCQCLNIPDIFGAGGSLPGGLAEYVRVPSADYCLVPVPDHLSDEQAVLVGDMLNTAYFAVEQCGLKPGSSLAVFGAGPVGLCAVHIARLFSPSQIFLIDSLENRLALGRKMGATHTLNFKEMDVVSEIMELTRNRGVNGAVDAVGGDAATLKNMARVVGAGGTISIVGLFSGKAEFPVAALLMKNITVKLGLGNFTNIRPIMSLVAAGMLDPLPLITHRMPMRHFEQAYAIFDEKRDNAVKVVLTN